MTDGHPAHLMLDVTADEWQTTPGPRGLEGRTVRVLAPGPDGHLRVALQGEFCAAGTVAEGPHAGTYVLDVVPDPDAPHLDDTARLAATTWHEHFAGNCPDTPPGEPCRQTWPLVPGATVQVRR